MAITGQIPRPPLGSSYWPLTDGSLVPLLKHTKPGPTPPTDTSGVVDGNPKNPPPEEMMNPDYQAT
ncbi:MAG: hypothetical protein ACRDRP_11640 [Pseudonocardiaceae bacterium]